MTKEFKFDATKVPQLKERLGRSMWKNSIPLFLFIIFIELFTLGLNIDKVLLIVIVAFPALVVWSTMKTAIKKVIEQYQTYRIVLSDIGVESYFKTKKALNWSDMKCELKDTGEIVLTNSNINWLLRQVSARWTILIPPELNDYDQLKRIILERAAWK